MVSVASIASQSSATASAELASRTAEKASIVAGDEWLNLNAPPVAAISAPVPLPPPSAALAEQISLGARAFAEFNDTLTRLMDYGLVKTWGERNAEREEQLGLPLSGWTGKEATSSPALAGASANATAAAAVADIASNQAAAVPTSSPTPDPHAAVPQDKTSSMLVEASPASTPSVAMSSATPLPPSPELVEQINLGARAFAEFNDTLERMVGYGLISSPAERNAQREEELGLPLSGWTGEEPASSPAPVSVAVSAVAASGGTDSTMGNSPVPTVTTAVSPALEQSQPVASPPVQPDAPVLSSAIVEGEGGGAAVEEEPVATVAPASEGPPSSSFASTPGPLPSLSSLTASSSRASSNWEPPSTWYVSNEPYAVRLAATERYRQTNLGAFQQTLFDEA